MLSLGSYLSQVFVRRSPPLTEKDEEVGDADGAVAVERSKNPRPVKARGW